MKTLSKVSAKIEKLEEIFFFSLTNFFSAVIWDNPLYVRGYSQSVLNKALNADTQFLASQLVMDYSLLVGIDDETNQLIVGLIGEHILLNTNSTLLRFFLCAFKTTSGRSRGTSDWRRSSNRRGFWAVEWGKCPLSSALNYIGRVSAKP